MFLAMSLLASSSSSLLHPSQQSEAEVAAKRALRSVVGILVVPYDPRGGNSMLTYSVPLVYGRDTEAVLLLLLYPKEHQGVGLHHEPADYEFYTVGLLGQNKQLNDGCEAKDRILRVAC